ncbi:hypothetical protein P7K49_021465, partial [Saguinus oedipus]
PQIRGPSAPAPPLPAPADRGPVSGNPAFPGLGPGSEGVAAGARLGPSSLRSLRRGACSSPADLALPCGASKRSGRRRPGARRHRGCL